MNEFYERFEEYIEGEMPDPERRDLERRLLEDPGLRSQFESYQSMRRHYREKWAREKPEEDLRKTMEGLRAEFFPPPAQRRKLKVWWLAAPAAAAACVLVLIMLRPQADLFQTYYQRPPSAFTERGYNDALLFQRAGQAYNEGRFEESLIYFDSLLLLYPNAAQLRFYKALSLLESGQMDKSQTELKSLAMGSSAYAEDAQWFLAMSYLKNQNYEACLQALAAIPADGPRSERARELERKLNKK